MSSYLGLRTIAVTCVLLFAASSAQSQIDETTAGIPAPIKLSTSKHYFTYKSTLAFPLLGQTFEYTCHISRTVEGVPVTDPGGKPLDTYICTLGNHSAVFQTMKAKKNNVIRLEAIFNHSPGREGGGQVLDCEQPFPFGTVRVVNGQPVPCDSPRQGHSTWQLLKVVNGAIVPVIDSRYLANLNTVVKDAYSRGIMVEVSLFNVWDGDWTKGPFYSVNTSSNTEPITIPNPRPPGETVCPAGAVVHPAFTDQKYFMTYDHPATATSAATDTICQNHLARMAQMAAVVAVVNQLKQWPNVIWEVGNEPDFVKGSTTPEDVLTWQKTVVDTIVCNDSSAAPCTTPGPTARARHLIEIEGHRPTTFAWLDARTSVEGLHYTALQDKSELSLVCPVAPGAPSYGALELADAVNNGTVTPPRPLALSFNENTVLYDAAFQTAVDPRRTDAAGRAEAWDFTFKGGGLFNAYSVNRQAYRAPVAPDPNIPNDPGDPGYPGFSNNLSTQLGPLGDFLAGFKTQLDTLSPTPCNSGSWCLVGPADTPWTQPHRDGGDCHNTADLYWSAFRTQDQKDYAIYFHHGTEINSCTPGPLNALHDYYVEISCPATQPDGTPGSGPPGYRLTGRLLLKPADACYAETWRDPATNQVLMSVKHEFNSSGNVWTSPKNTPDYSQDIVLQLHWLAPNCADPDLTASFTVSCDFLYCTFDPIASSPPEAISSYAWTWGDGTTQTTSGPVAVVHNFSAPGTFPVTLTVSNLAGNVGTTTTTVDAEAQPPMVNLIVSCTLTYCYFDTNLVSGSAAIEVWNWNFGDTTSAVGPHPDHTYPRGGNYDLTLVVTDGYGISESITRTIAVTGPPEALFGSSCAGLTCTFDAGLSTEGSSPIASYAWSFGDGTTGSGVAASHTYAAPGTYSVTVTVTDTANRTATQTQPVLAANPPVASFTLACSGLACSFDGNGSTAGSGTIASFNWSFGDSTTGSGVTASHTYAAAADPTVTLTVTNSFGLTGTASRTFHVDALPVARFTASCTGNTCTLNAGSSTDDLGIVAYDWTFGDLQTGTGVAVTHTYATVNRFTVGLTVTDTSGQKGSTSQPVSTDPTPVACFTWSCSQRTCTFDGRCSTDNQPLANYQWSFGDGTTGVGATPSHAYASGGAPVVTLTVTDSASQTAATSHTLAVKRPPVAANDTASTLPGTPVDINVLANDSDPDSDSLTVTGLTAPAHGTVSLNANGTVHYTPAAGYTGTDLFTYRDQDVQDVSNPATVTVAINRAPIPRDDTWAAAVNYGANIAYGSLLQNDYDPDGDPLTVASVNPAGLAGSLDCSGGTGCYYTPNPGFVGVTSFTYTVSDGRGGTAVATVRIKVGVANAAPAPQDDLLETPRNTPLVFTRATLLANDSDPNGDVLSVLWVYLATATSQGTVSCSAAYYTCTYTPPAGFTGVDVLYYRATDGITFTDARIRILVRPPNPVVLDAREDQIFFTTTGAFLSYAWMTANDYSPAGGALTVVSIDTTGLLGALDCTTFTTGCQYTRGTNDPTRFRYTVRDAQGNQDTATVILKPGNAAFNQGPTPADDTLVTRANTPLAFTIFDLLKNDYDLDNDALNVGFASYSTANGHLTCSSPVYTCTYTPNAGFTGTDHFIYVVNDNNYSTNANLNFTVLPQIAKDSQVMAQSVPVSLFAGQSYPVSLRLKNVGTVAWNLVGPVCNAFRLGSSNPMDNFTWGQNRSELPSTVAPGGEVTVNFTITAPTTPGTYNFQRRMVHECVEWFGDASPNLTVTVSP